MKLWLYSRRVTAQQGLYAVLVIKANMNSDKPLQMAAIFFISNFYLKQGIG